ncbi:transporter [Pollutimonas bauzanensis]|uniref:transporter n=1 Tax=Pollutimonas bauzanensis TaxID=658167 RepID=UPI00333F10EB
MKFKLIMFMLLALGLQASSNAEEVDLAKQLANPVAAMVSVPFQFNYDSGYGSSDGYKSYVNMQPVIPFSINEDWNIISRTILPVVSQHNIVGKSGSQSGLGDITQSFFFSPKGATSDGLIWGAGPALLIPSATHSLLGARKWGLGPSAVLLKQKDGLTYGALANHIWSLAGDSDRRDISSTFLQPFLSYTNNKAWTFGLDTESSYDWKETQWSVPVNFTVSKVVKLGSQPVSFQVGARYWAAAPESGPAGWGFRAGVTFLFSK